MSRWLGKCLCIIAALGVLDGHLVVVQTVAWATMLHDRVGEQGVAEAVESTFSGAAPCAMCSTVQKEREKKEDGAPVPESKLTVKYPPVASKSVVVFPPKLGAYVLRGSEPRLSLSARGNEPPSPPPRV